MKRNLFVLGLSAVLLSLGFGAGFFYRPPVPPLIPSEPDYLEHVYHEDDRPLLAVLPATPIGQQPVIDHPKGWSVYFSPKGGCEAAVVKTIASAKKKIRVATYVITSKAIVQALVDAKARGVDVAVIADFKESRTVYTLIPLLIQAGIPVVLDHNHAIFHNKYIIIDDEVVITGSFNFTTSAENRNAENLLVIHDVTLAKRFTDNWQSHHDHSKPPAPK